MCNRLGHANEVSREDRAYIVTSAKTDKQTQLRRKLMLGSLTKTDFLSRFGWYASFAFAEVTEFHRGTI